MASIGQRKASSPSWVGLERFLIQAGPPVPAPPSPLNPNRRLEPSPLGWGACVPSPPEPSAGGREGGHCSLPGTPDTFLFPPQGQGCGARALGLWEPRLMGARASFVEVSGCVWSGPALHSFSPPTFWDELESQMRSDVEKMYFPLCVMQSCKKIKDY